MASLAFDFFLFFAASANSVRHTRLTASSSSSAAVRLYPRIAPASTSDSQLGARCVLYVHRSADVHVRACMHVSALADTHTDRHTKTHTDTQMTHSKTQTHRHSFVMHCGALSSPQQRDAAATLARCTCATLIRTCKMRSHARGHARSSKDRK